MQEKKNGAGYYWDHTMHESNVTSSGQQQQQSFKSQTSFGRLELKPSRTNQGSGTWIAVFQALLSKAKSLGIFHPFKSPFVNSTQVNTNKATYKEKLSYLN